MNAHGLWVARHAPVTARGVCYGQHDIPVEVDHDVAAERLAASWEASGAGLVERIWASPWERTRGLAEALAKRLHTRVEIDSRLAELSFGAWEGRSYTEIEANDGARFATWMADWEHLAPPAGESVPMLRRRIDDWMRSIEGAGGLAITHAGPIRMLRAIVRGLPYADVAREDAPYLALERVR